MNWYLDGLVQQGRRDALAQGLKAFVGLYFDEYTDATAVEPEVLVTLDNLLTVVPVDYDVEDLVRDAEADINAVGGVLSATTNKRHQVSTYSDAE